jgi:hypothetical protein
MEISISKNHFSALKISPKVIGAYFKSLTLFGSG